MPTGVFFIWAGQRDGASLGEPLGTRARADLSRRPGKLFSLGQGLVIGLPLSGGRGGCTGGGNVAPPPPRRGLATAAGPKAEIRGSGKNASISTNERRDLPWGGGATVWTPDIDDELVEASFARPEAAPPLT
jgi:hypothetical protein